MTEQTEETFPVYIGYDAREDDAYRVCKHSLIRHSSWPLHVIQMRQDMLRYIGLYDRDFTEKDGVKYDVIDGKPFSTDFSFTRFLVPAMTQYQGWALFCDSDMLYRADLRELINMADDRYACMVVKHDYSPQETTKMDGQVQEAYSRKNWSSFILWNCAHPANANLTVRAVNTEPGNWLHGFGWLADDQIGSLPEAWNWLEGWSNSYLSQDMGPANVHFTRGGPWFDTYRNVAYGEEWLREKALIDNGHETKQRRDAQRFTSVPV